MTAATEATKPKADAPALAVVVFGRGSGGKPHASAFGPSDAILAETAAGLMGMRVLRVETDEMRELAGKLPRGRVFASGRAFVPFVKAGLYDALAALAGPTGGLPEAGTASACPAADMPPESLPRPEDGQGDGSQTESDEEPLPPNWDAITLGSVVLAPFKPKKGWWEAVVIKVAGDQLTLEWRDYPEEPRVVRRRNQLALLHPAANSA